ncbi:cell division cycle 20 homolog [Paramuricea clavata]|uniref:Cell division cycle 20 homolog n=1 Tax=Paramuricea clavata TaxID=317549 RepID=A0A6S7J740_PARCT|nr:cell division cycle 20 homolog [Paramuricea clavata]
MKSNSFSGYQNNLRVVYCQNRGSSKAKSSRYISKVPEKILDAPELLNDFYLNLVDWGSNNCIAIGLGSGVYIWNYETQATKLLLEIPNNDYVSSVSWVKDGNVLAIGCSNTRIHLWDVETEKPLRTMLGHAGRVGSLAWNSCILSSGGRTGKIINHDVRIAEHIVSTLHEHTQDVCGLAWSPDGRMLASGGNDNLLNVWSPLAVGQLPLHSLTHHQAAVKGVSWCPWQSNVLASGGGTADRYIRLWNVTTGVCLNSIDTKSQISSILWSKDYKELITGHGFSNNQLSIWKYPSMTRVADLVDHSARVLCMSMSPSGEHVASAGADETLRIWKCFDRSQLKKKSAAGGIVKKTLNTNLTMINRIR